MTFFKDNMFKKLIEEKDVSFILLIITMFLLPFSVNFSTFTIILAVCLKVIQVAFFDFKLFDTNALKTSSIIGLVFFSYIIVNSIAQTDFIYTISVFEKQFQHWLLLFLMPILLRSKKSNGILIRSFFSGLCVSILYVFILLYLNKQTLDQDSFDTFIDLHHTYLSIFLLFVINHILIRLIKNQDSHSIPQIIVQVSTIIGAFWLIYLIDSKASVVLFAVLFVIHVFPELSKKNAVKYLLTFLVIVAISIVFNKNLKVSYEKALDFRFQLWGTSAKIIEDNPFFGNLKSPEKELVDYQHYLDGKYYYPDKDLNSHNQFLSILLKYGIFGFMIFMCYAIVMFKYTNPKTSKIVMRETIGFLAIITLVFYIENVLDRHQGIVFYTLFYNYYVVAIENA